jgi:hypothetical protein
MPSADTAFQQIPARSKNYNAVHSYSDIRVLSRLNSSPVSRPTPGACPLWMAPALQVRFGVWRVGRVQSSVRPVGAVGRGLLALMGSANRVPFCFAGYDAFDMRRVVPVPGLTGPAITSRRSPQPPEADFPR